jgi:LacI family sucrose operon transcriptional repressor
MLRRQRVDGIIFGAHTSLASEKYQSLQRPVIGLDRKLAESIPYVAADHEEGGRLAAQELIRSGCRNVVQFGGVEDSVITPSSQRHFVFRKVVEAHGVVCASYPRQPNYSNYHTYQESAARLFEEHPDVDGIFGTDLYAAACLQYAQAHGIRVPEDVKIIAYDGTYITKFLHPEMTTICQPIQALADEAVRMITEMIKGNEVKEKKVILPISIRRGNTTTADQEGEPDDYGPAGESQRI